MITCEPSISVIVAPARFAMERTTSVPAARSPVATTAQEGRLFQAGWPDGSEKPELGDGRWMAPISAASRSERSPAKASWTFAGSIENSVADPPSPVGYCRGTSAVFRTLSFEAASASPKVSPSSGANAAT